MLVVAGFEVSEHGWVFGGASAADIRRLLGRHLHDHLGSTIEEITFQAGVVGAVFGLQLSDGQSVVVKAFQPAIDLKRAAAVARCQSLLNRRGFPCAAVISDPSVTEGVALVVEQEFAPAISGNPHEADSRDAMTLGLARQISLLRDVDGADLNRGRPAWANWDHGAWPPPHVPIFDFTTPASGYAWLDRRAQHHADELRRTAALPPLIGHTDWVWQNVAVRQGEFVGGYDWDSLAFLPEPVAVGLDAGAYTQGSPLPPDAPSWGQVISFIDSYQQVRGSPFTTDERTAAEHAAGWVRCYNARCQLDFQQRLGGSPPEGSFIEQMDDDPQS